ncbi:hypothetical protein BZG35_06110 [Brevundimonas sp. LM2]|uniref:hypothetical protein n=1 Tax=Brevundimonas sp. LM2 TaxID=1938605 RepID=UPI000983A220|nr:hypothetical protein [Brevundimonas sp. LM2]AQR61271.1 hypothetical protein BZG35_06110 [Brevundimonas sp. LM2]
MSTVVQKTPGQLANEALGARERRLAWESARLTEADEDFMAGRYISGDEAMRWLENEIAEAEAAEAREAD